MARWLTSLDEEGGLTVVGRMAIRGLVVRALEQRLRVAAALAEHPEIRDVPIERPLFILGFPRTGTTLLHNLVAQDQHARVPLLWELVRPAPPPEAATRESDPRIAVARREVETMYGFVPDLLRIHAQGAALPDECYHLFAITFLNFIADISAPCPSYLRWLVGSDMVGAYRYYRTLLQILTWRTPGRYLALKAPSHIFALDALLAVFPDACIVQTHRDVAQAAASSCSLFETARRAYAESRDPRATGEEWLEIWGGAMERALAVRDAADPVRFYDVRFEEVMADPVGTVRRIHARFGIEAAPGTDERMSAWLREHPKDKHGAHQYSLSHYGLDAARLAERFAGYNARFGVSR
jgi:hypothetical protein